jgi:phosphoglucosamine mutase
MKRSYFGTDGVRGLYGSATMNEAFAWRLGVAAARWLAGRGVIRGKVLIGRDTRTSGVSLTQALADGLACGGCEPATLEIVPTPAVSRAVRVRGAALGVVVTASHNPATDNGIKFFGANGVKLTDAEEAAIEALLPERRTDATTAPLPMVDAVSDYLYAMEGVLHGSLSGWKIALDTANGATVLTSSRVLRDHGAEVIQIGAEPDGLNINQEVGSEHPEKLASTVRLHSARLGIAHDGDGDRCVLCDERGEILDGDELLAILACQALKEGRLRNNTLVVTVQSNLGVDAAVAAAGGRVVRTPVGDRYVIERMLAEDAQLGGESSGHVICADVSPTGDGLVAALKVLAVMLATGRPLSELRRQLVKFPQLSVALKVRTKKPLETLAHLPAAIRAVEAEFGARGRVLVRYSGTESKLRLLVEGPTQAEVQAGMDRLQAAAQADLEVL